MKRIGLALSFLVLIYNGCANRIEVPDRDKASQESNEVLLVDYGFGAHLVLPRGSGSAVVYSYGEWEWYAKNQTQWYRAFPVLFWRTPGTLGRQELHHLDPYAHYKSQYPQHLTFLLQARADLVEALLMRLDREFEENKASLHHNPTYDMDFVKSPMPYHAFWNCNHVTVDWLRQLGFRVRQNTLFSRWVVVHALSEVSRNVGKH